MSKLFCITIGHFIVVRSEAWPLNGRENGGDLALIQNSMLLLSKSSCANLNYFAFK